MKRQNPQKGTDDCAIASGARNDTRGRRRRGRGAHAGPPVVIQNNYVRQMGE